MRLCSALAAFSFSSFAIVSAASRIDDPKDFVTEVYRRLVAAQSSHSSYTPPSNIYTPRLAKLIQDDKKKAKGEVGCLDFVFWVNGQDWRITKLSITSEDAGQDRKTVTAKFVNEGVPQQIHFDFRHDSAGWLLDEVRSKSDPPWTLSSILKCSP